MYTINVSAEAQAASLRWMTSMSEADKWNLSSEEMALLLGLPEETLQNVLKNLKHEAHIELPSETVERLSHLLGIWKCLQFIAPKDRMDLAYSGFLRANNNERFSGQSIKRYLLDQNKIEGFVIVRQYLESNLS